MYNMCKHTGIKLMHVDRKCTRLHITYAICICINVYIYIHVSSCCTFAMWYMNVNNGVIYDEYTIDMKYLYIYINHIPCLRNKIPSALETQESGAHVCT